MEIFWTYARVFLCGGTLCLIGQILIDKTSLTPARILVSYVVAGVESTPGWWSGAELGPPCPSPASAICCPRVWRRQWQKKAHWAFCPAALLPRQAGSPLRCFSAC